MISITLFKELVHDSELYYFNSVEYTPLIYPNGYTQESPTMREREREKYLHNKLCWWKTVTEGGNISKRNHRLRSGLLQTKRLTTSFAPISHAASTRGQGKSPSIISKTEGHQTRVIHSEEWTIWENRGTLKVIDQHRERARERD